MPSLDFRCFSLVQAFDDELLLAEPLFFPDVSRLDGDEARLAEAVADRVRESVEALPAGDVHRRRPAARADRDRAGAAARHDRLAGADRPDVSLRPSGSR